ncbi:energy transducer TonB [Novilysobacter arseniciresistens]|uniref:energy transducer TonB n=1 Tax=Novilysobacter arseniciresistens TaxID=1385522 RepID=UPI00068E6DFA|nr:energy transducer TonB [Lysobacter arseniciresistens]
MSTHAIGRSHTSIRTALLGTALLALLAACEGGPPDTSMMVPPTQPVALDTPPPAYPAELACFDRGGTVGLLMKIGVDGSPADIRVETSSGHPQLDQSALDAVQGWKFRPATRNGNPVATDLRVPVTFSPPDVRPEMCFQYDE